MIQLYQFLLFQAFRISFISIKIFAFVTSLLVVWGTASNAQNTIRYVSTTGTNTNPATAVSWATSTNNLQSAINSLSSTGGEVWVAAGTYKPTTGMDRTISFSMKNGVAIYGGFPASGNPGFADRNPASYTTTLSGDIGSPDNGVDNSYRVIYNPASLSLTTTAVLDGFVVSNGNANGGIYYTGGGMYNDGSNESICSPTITNCTFSSNTANSGSAIYNDASYIGESNPVITTCNFLDNWGRGGAVMNKNGDTYTGTAYIPVGISKPQLIDCNFTGNYGGGIYNDNSTPTIINCNFNANYVGGISEGSGGGIYNQRSAPRIINCSFNNNSCFYNGGGIGNQNNSNSLVINCRFTGNFAGSGNGGAAYNTGGSTMSLINCTITDNKADLGRGRVIANTAQSTVQLTNCILWNNGGINSFSGPGITVTSSLLEPAMTGYADGSNNLTISASPFVSDTDLNLKADSPAINAGNNAAYTMVSGPETDIAGKVRVQYGLVDMGAYESPYSYDLTPTLYARPSTVSSLTTVSVVVDVVELNSVTTSSSVTLRISRDPKLTLSFVENATSVGGRSVQNSAWNYNGQSGGYYVLTTKQPILGGSILSVGLNGSLNPDNTTGLLTTSVAVLGGSGEDFDLTNNTDADKIDYFQQ